MRTWISLLACLCICGCSKQDDALRKQIDEQDAKIHQLEKQISTLQDDQQKMIGGKIADVQRYARQVGLAQKETERAQRNYDQQLSTLRSELQQLQENAAAPAAPAPTSAAPAAVTEADNTPAQAAAPVSVYTPSDPVLSDFIEPPAATDADLFPVAVNNVEGRKVVTGSHTSTQTVPAKETYTDDFGNTVHKTKTEQVLVNEYDYQVAFSARNLTRSPKDLTVGAGRKTRAVTLQPGQVLEDQLIDSAYGADLTVRIGGEVRRFPVSYGE